MPSEIERSDRTKSAKTICLFSAKGGTGKTTISLVIARHLAFKGHRVLVLDCDLVTAGVTLYLNGNNRDALAPENCLFDILDLGSDATRSPGDIHTDIGRKPIVPVKIPLQGREKGEIHLIASVRSAISSRPESVDQGRFKEAFGLSASELEHRVKELLARLAPDFDYIIIDTRGGLDEFSIIPPLLSDLSLLVSDQSRLASYQLLHSRTRVEALARDLGRQVAENETPAYRGVILNKSAGDPEVVRENFADSVLIAAGQPLLGVIPFVDDVLRSAESGDVPSPNIEFDYWLAKCLREGLNRARMDPEPFESLGRGSWLRDKVMHHGPEGLLFVALAILAVVATSAVYRFEAVSFWMGLHSTTIIAALLCVCTVGLAVAAYGSKWLRHVFNKAALRWARWALVGGTVAACCMSGYTFWNVERRAAADLAAARVQAGPLVALRDAVSGARFLARTEASVPGCGTKTVTLSVPRLLGAYLGQPQEFEAVIPPEVNGAATFDEDPQIQVDDSAITVTARVRGMGQRRGAMCSAGAVSAVVELRRKRIK